MRQAPGISVTVSEVLMEPHLPLTRRPGAPEGYRPHCLNHSRFPYRPWWLQWSFQIDLALGGQVCSAEDDGLYSIHLRHGCLRSDCKTDRRAHNTQTKRWSCSPTFPTLLHVLFLLLLFMYTHTHSQPRTVLPCCEAFDLIWDVQSKTQTTSQSPSALNGISLSACLQSCTSGWRGCTLPGTFPITRNTSGRNLSAETAIIAAPAFLWLERAGLRYNRFVPRIQELVSSACSVTALPLSCNCCSTKAPSQQLSFWRQISLVSAENGNLAILYNHACTSSEQTECLYCSCHITALRSN